MGLKSRIAQMNIQQMAFMILAVFLFFALVGLFFLRIEIGSMGKGAGDIFTEEAISSLEVVAGMTELNCNSKEFLCLDEDKLRIMSGEFGKEYKDFWPVTSIEVFKVYPKQEKTIECPALNCNYYKIHKENQKNNQTYSTFVSICNDFNGERPKCDIGKLVVGRKTNEQK